MLCSRKHTNSLPNPNHAHVLTLAEKKSLGWRREVYLLAHCGHWLHVYVNGQPKTWKTRPNNVRVPYKYGMYGPYGYIDQTTEVRVPAQSVWTLNPAQVGQLVHPLAQAKPLDNP